MNYKSILIATVIFILSNLVFSETYYVKPDGDDSTTGTSWQTAFKTITKAVNTTKAGDSVWVAEGTYQEGDTITIPEGISVYGGFSGTETSIEERNISEHITIIDGDNNYRCISNYGKIDGFYVTNGNTGSGGGIRNSYGIISNCTLYYNSASHYGGGIDNFRGDVVNCMIFSNSSDLNGGGDL